MVTLPVCILVGPYVGAEQGDGADELGMRPCVAQGETGNVHTASNGNKIVLDESRLLGCDAVWLL
jgi:hypothetical protein